MRTRMLPVIGVIVLSCGALADDGHNNNSSFETSLVGSTPGGVVSGGAPLSQ